jgi:hypothetical protein
MTLRTTITGEAIVLTNVHGRCRWCQCTLRRPCVPGCKWTDRSETLCIECVELDAMVRTPAGRRFIAGLTQPLFAARRKERRRTTKAVRA